MERHRANRESSCHRERSHVPQRPLALSLRSFRSRFVISTESEQDRAQAVKLVADDRGATTAKAVFITVFVAR